MWSCLYSAKNHPLDWSFHQFKKGRRKETAAAACYFVRVHSVQVPPRAGKGDLFHHPREHRQRKTQ